MTDKLLKLFTNLKDRDLRNEGLMVAEGNWLVERLLSSRIKPVAVLCPPENALRYKALIGEKCPLIVKDGKDISQIIGFRFHRGVLAAAERPTIYPLEKLLLLCDVEKTVVLCPGISELENMGGLMRTAAAFGVKTLFFSKNSPDPFNRKVLRVSMGAAFTLKHGYIEDPVSTASKLKKAGYTLVGTTPHHSETPLKKPGPKEKIALIMGNEEKGLSNEWLDQCDTLFTIPMAKGTDSLNVNVAAGICLYSLTAI
ncbi:MAG: RNA methyltransferase [Spirochaetales bacterium]|nr:RNA methyltransferase [Spirochaetales bacterium]